MTKQAVRAARMFDALAEETAAMLLGTKATAAATDIAAPASAATMRRLLMVHSPGFGDPRPPRRRVHPLGQELLELGCGRTVLARDGVVTGFVPPGRCCRTRLEREAGDRTLDGAEGARKGLVDAAGEVFEEGALAELRTRSTSGRVRVVGR
ncbi:hypothetical protein [Micromonospora sp. NPDC049102]|uniref:hypothetical protein n=1 Tax=Micromonospora sp. NPDC049102 TaxID=3364265 RepID=UPI00371F15E0